MKTAGAPQQLLDLVPTMDAGVVQQDEDVASQAPHQFAEEVANKRGIDIGLEESEVQVEAASLRAHRDTRNHGELVTPIAVLAQRGATTRGPGSQHQREKQKARFVEKDYVGTQPSGVFLPSAIPALSRLLSEPHPVQ